MRWYLCYSLFFFFFNDTATTEIYTLSLHDALPISNAGPTCRAWRRTGRYPPGWPDRKSTRLNSSHSQISYAVFCFKKKNKKNKKKQLLFFLDWAYNSLEEIYLF